MSSTNKLGEESLQTAVARLHPLASCSRRLESRCACTGEGLFRARRVILGVTDPRTRQRPRVVDCILALDCECVTAEKSSE